MRGREKRSLSRVLMTRRTYSRPSPILGAMPDLPVSAARSRLDDVVDDACASHEPVFLTCRGRRVAAVIDADDLECLTQAAEDLADIEAADAARAEIAEHGTIPWDEVKADLGLAFPSRSTDFAGSSQ